MDPNETLRCLRALSKQIIKENENEEMPDNGMHMANIFQALDEWIVKGGFLPQDWQKGQTK